MNKHFALLLKLFISFGILAYIFSKIPIPEVLSALEKTHILLYFISFGFVFLAQIANAHRMKILLEEQEIRFTTFQVFKINMITAFYGFFLPGTLAGGAVRWYKFTKPTQKGPEALISIIFNRLIQTVGILFVGCLFFLLDRQAHQYKTVGASLFVLLCLFLVIIFLLANERIAKVLSGWISVIPFFPKILKEKIHRILESASHYDKGLRPLFIKMVFLTIIGQLCIVFGQYLLILSLEVDLSLITIGWIRSISALLILLPISFSGIGVRDGVLIYFLSLYGAPAEEAVALSFLILSRLIILAGVGACLEMKHLFFEPKQKANQLNAPTNLW